MALSTGQYNEVKRIYEERQRKSRAELEQKREQAYRALPGLRAYDEAISAASAELARAALLQRPGSEETRRRLDDLREERDALLSAGGFSPEELQRVSYVCPICRDTGYADGKKCVCFRQQEIAILYRESGLERQLEEENFSVMTDRYYDPEYVVDRETGLKLPEYMRRVAERCRQFVREFAEKGGNLLFTGPAGVGKTFFTHCIAKELLEQGVPVVYVTAAELTDTMAAVRLREGDDGESERARMIGECSLLIVDDLGTELNNSMTNAELFRCLDERLKRGQSTVISTNLSLNELRDTYADRIASRIISGYQIVRFFGPDIRIRKHYG